MAQHENRWRDDDRDWRDEERWRGEGRRYGGDRDEYLASERGGRGVLEWQGGREVYRGQGGHESGGYGRDPYGRDMSRESARESERAYGRSFGGGRDDSRSGYGGYGGYSGGGSSAAWREERGQRDFSGDTDYRRGYGAGYGERDYGQRYGQQYGSRDYSRDFSGDVSRGSSSSGGMGRERDYGAWRGREMGHDPRRGRVEERGFWEQAGDEVASWLGDDDAERRRHQDEQRAAQNRGRGPRGYARSDDRVREDVNDRLTDDPYVDASEIDVSVGKGEVTLSGTVAHRSAKRRAEDIAESISGVTHVQNNLRVRQQTGGMMGSSTGAGASAMAGAGTGTTGTMGGTTAGTATGTTPGTTAGAGTRRT